MRITHDSFCYQPRGTCHFLTCTCDCHEKCPTHGCRQPCHECRAATGYWWTTVRPALGKMTSWPKRKNTG